MEAIVGLGLTDWTGAAEAVATAGWCRLAGALPAPVVEELIASMPGPWHELPEEEGNAGVRQAGFACWTSLESAAAPVRDLATEVTACLTAARPDGVAAVPPFNEAQWTLYPRGAGHITAHRDPLGVGGVIAIATLTGRARFFIGGRAEPRRAEWETGVGDLVLLRGNGWPEAGLPRPMHGVEPPADGERIILTFRHNRGGAGASYF
ncbi:MAG TPA: hypothetical protein VE990_20200 [Acidimicrobiales bacterium]|nr:hypothetical protein [Acidimicrobiales bacterium]